MSLGSSLKDRSLLLVLSLLSVLTACDDAQAPKGQEPEVGSPR